MALTKIKTLLFSSCFRTILTFSPPMKIHKNTLHPPVHPGLTLQISDTLSVTRPVWHNPLVLFPQRGWSGECSDSNICGGQSYHLNRTVSVMSSQGCGWQARQEMRIVAENNSDVHNVTLLFQCRNVHRRYKLTSEAPASNIADSRDTGQNIHSLF